MRIGLVYAIFSKAVPTIFTIVSVSLFFLKLANFLSNFGFLKKMLLGRDGFGKNCKCQVNPHAIRASKIHILSMLEILRVKTSLSTLWYVPLAQKDMSKNMKLSI